MEEKTIVEEATVKEEAVTAEVVEGSKLKKAAAKAGRFIKRNWKTILVGTAAAVGGYLLGSRCSDAEDAEYEDCDEDDSGEELLLTEGEDSEEE